MRVSFSFNCGVNMSRSSNYVGAGSLQELARSIDGRTCDHAENSFETDGNHVPWGSAFDLRRIQPGEHSQGVVMSQINDVLLIEEIEGLQQRQHIVDRAFDVRIEHVRAGAGHFGAEGHAVHATLADGAGEKMRSVRAGIEEQILREVEALLLRGLDRHADLASGELAALAVQVLRALGMRDRVGGIALVDQAVQGSAAVTYAHPQPRKTREDVGVLEQ